MGCKIEAGNFLLGTVYTLTYLPRLDFRALFLSEALVSLPTGGYFSGGVSMNITVLLGIAVKVFSSVTLNRIPAFFHFYLHTESTVF